MNLYCKVFVDGEPDRDRLLEIVASITSGTISRRTVASGTAQIDVISNEDFGSNDGSEEDQFLYSQFYLDITPGNVLRESYIDSIRRLLEGLRKSGLSAVAACDFEGELHHA